MHFLCYNFLNLKKFNLILIIALVVVASAILNSEEVLQTQLQAARHLVEGNLFILKSVEIKLIAS